MKVGPLNTSTTAFLKFSANNNSWNWTKTSWLSNYHLFHCIILSFKAFYYGQFEIYTKPKRTVWWTMQPQPFFNLTCLWIIIYIKSLSIPLTYSFILFSGIISNEKHVCTCTTCIMFLMFYVNDRLSQEPIGRQSWLYSHFNYLTLHTEKGIRAVVK